ncbi:MAG: hypothetical protein AB8G18_00230 [Gammaproteobacteria bacterium]
MIHSLRRRHRAMIVASALATLLILVVALQVRPVYETDNTLVRYHDTLPKGVVLSGGQEVRVSSAEIQVDLYKPETTATQWHVRLSAIQNRQTAGPDMLLYWQSGEVTNELAADAYLLGPLLAQRDTVVQLPYESHVKAQSQTRTITSEQPLGQLVFFSLAHQRVVESIELIRLIEAP